MLKLASLFITAIIAILISLFFFHSYPRITNDYMADEVYFVFYMNSRSVDELLPVFKNQLAMRNNVVQDYMIAYWMNENGFCDYLDQLKENQHYYTNILLDSLQVKNSKIHHLQMINILTSDINELSNGCNK